MASILALFQNWSHVCGKPRHESGVLKAPLDVTSMFKCAASSAYYSSASIFFIPFLSVATTTRGLFGHFGRQVSCVLICVCVCGGFAVCVYICVCVCV